jgi:hypothetical protein
MRSFRVEGTGSSPTILGEIRFEDGVAHITRFAPAECTEEGTYEAHVIQADGQPYQLYFVVVEDSCDERVSDLTNQVQKMRWVAPEEATQ